jgi:small GTP-binding protein
MAKKSRAGAESRSTSPTRYPPGVELHQTLRCGTGRVWSVAFHPDGSKLASALTDRAFAGQLMVWNLDSGKRVWSDRNRGCRSVAFHPRGEALASTDFGRITLWDAESGAPRNSIETSRQWVVSLAFDPRGSMLASAGFDKTIGLWNYQTNELITRIEAFDEWAWCAAFDPAGETIAAVSDDQTVRLFEVPSGRLTHVLEGHSYRVFSVVFHPHAQILASGSGDATVKIWDPQEGRLLRNLEGHTAHVTDVVFSPDGRLLASKSHDQTIRLWNCQTWELVAVIPQSMDTEWGAGGLAFHPTRPLLAAGAGEESDRIEILELDFDTLLSLPAEAATSFQHVTGKIVLLGDHSVGKSGLAYRLIHGRFETQAATHGQQFWVYPDLGYRRADGTDCEAILWDLAGQPDYRLVHALFVDNADLALVLFDSSNLHDPLHGVGFWLKQLEAQRSRCPVILVAAQTDRGTCSMTEDELKAFCRREGIGGPIATSAFTGEGISRLTECMKELIAWDDKVATVTTATFKRIKDYVLGLKEAETDYQNIVTPEVLRESLQQSDPDWKFSDTEMLTAIGHLENYGYVKCLQTSDGRQRILLQPDLLNNLASSFVLEARRHPKGLGALEEKRLLAGGYDFQELRELAKEEREVMLDSATLLFLKHHVCFRETDPLRMEPYLVFPELINLKKPPEEDPDSEDGVAYSVTGPTENVFASLVVLLGYTHTFTRTAQWHDNARYEIGEGLICAFRQEVSRDGELELVLSYGPDVGRPVRALFQGLFESFLGRRNVTVTRFEPVRCTNAKCGQLLDRAVVRQRIKDGKSFAFCNDCAEKLTFPTVAEPIQLTRELKVEVALQRRAAEQRTRFEQTVFRLLAYTAERKIEGPETFISYAWGVPEHERWVEKRLAPDLQKAGIGVVLDRWHNTIIGSSVARFVDRIEKAGRVVMVGTPLYRRKYENKEANTGYVVAAEVDLINNRLLGTEADKLSVLPLLLEGEKAEALPPLVQGRVYGDFRNDLNYFVVVFELILSLYRLGPEDPVLAELRESLREPRTGDPQVPATLA